MTDIQRAIINATWEHHIKSSGRWEWIPTAALYSQFANPSLSRKSGKNIVLSAIESLSGSIMYEHEDHYYGLTFLGMLLTDEGQEGIDLIASCLKLFQLKHDSGLPLKEIRIDSQELASSLNLSEGKLRLLYKLLDRSQFANASGDINEYTVSISHWNDEFLFEDNLRDYVEREALKSYDPALPVGRAERSNYQYERQNYQYEGQSVGIPSEFSFIRNDELRELLETDWKDVQAVQGVRAWKSCVILCGSILEGVLFDILSRDEKKSLDVYASIRLRNSSIGKKATDLGDLNLASLVEVAYELKFLTPGAFHLSHALRHSRNLVHPEKLLREKLEVTEAEANIAVSSVRMFLRIGATL